jgi:hypothetical protein
MGMNELISKSSFELHSFYTVHRDSDVPIWAYNVTNVQPWMFSAFWNVHKPR